MISTDWNNYTNFLCLGSWLLILGSNQNLSWFLALDSWLSLKSVLVLGS